jgi:serine/threonine-protein kinase
MSRVFVAEELSLGRKVVVKVLPPDLAATVNVERFRREIQLAARLQHPHIVPVLAAGISDGLPYYTMPFIEGESLRARLARAGELPLHDAARILRDVLSALAYAHDHGVVHRDIKPDNVLLTGKHAVVADFGVAKALSASTNPGSSLTSLGVALGTPAYMSPEQAAADPTTDHRADIYAVGAMAYEMLTGQQVFSARSPQAMLAAHAIEKPEPIDKRRPSVPRALASLIMRSLEKHAADRPQSAGEMLAELDAAVTPSGATEPTGFTPVSHHMPRSRAVVAAGAAVAVLILIAAGGFAWERSRGKTVAATTTTRSIAVLPLDNATGDTATQFFADGMTDELTSTLAKIPGVRVASRSATSAAMKTGGDANLIAQRLRVGAILEGRIRRAGNRMRLTAQLSDAKDGLILWTETYDREVRDAFLVQDEVARAIAAALRVTLGGDQQLASRGTSNSESHDLYLRGRYVQSKYTESDLRKSIELFQAALAKDPNYAMAWAGIADSWGMLADDFLPPREAVPKARAAVARGMALDSTVPELRVTRGLLALFYDRDAFAAERLLGSALRSSPDLHDAAITYPLVLWTVGLRDSAAAFLRRAVERDPTSPSVLDNATNFFLSTIGDSVTAFQYCDRLVELGAGEACTANIAVARGHTDTAIALYRRAVSEQKQLTGTGGSSGLWPTRSLVRALAKGGRLAEARAIVQQTEQRANAGGPYVREDVVAMMWGLVGDSDRAFAWWERALRAGSAGIGVLYHSTVEDPVRHDPRMRALAKRAGLPDPPPYWP